ncbi:MAG: substrate-binding domain-containing protein [Chloroflexota bacterium]|nr:substrate-binding domain-containing protein [Chloroflexota bacterium]MDE2896605.1 substrate-binding domain-containing protein [Chloroflexota bacterium]
MRTLIVLLLGTLIGAAALGGVWATHQNAEDEQLEVRVAVERLADGSVEIGLQQRERDGEWGETKKPERRFLLPDTEVGKVRYSSPVVFDLVTRAEHIAAEYRDYLKEVGKLYGHYFVRRFHSEDELESLPPVLCLVHPEEATQGTLCEGIGETFPTGVDIIESDDFIAIADEVERRLLAGEVSQIMATSNQHLETAVFARDHILLNDPDLGWTWVHYWFEPIDPQLPAGDDLFCVVSHGGRDLFWGLASDTALVAAAALGINLRTESFSEVSDQADAIRQCVEDGAVSIATTLVSPDVLAPAIAEATAAGIPVMSFNSGVQAAADVGTSFHIGLDDRRAGEIAGEQFNREGTEGTILCVIHEPDNIGLQERCEGLAATYANGEIETWSYEGRDAADAVLERYAQGDIGAVMALSDTVGSAVLRAQWPDPEVPLATFGFNLGFAKWVEEGKIMFAIYDHPLVQTYLGVMGALLIERMRLDPVTLFNGMAMLIEPQIADAEQMRRVTNALIPQEIQDRYLSGSDSAERVDSESGDSGDDAGDGDN